MTYRDFLLGLRLRHFSPAEVISYGSAVRRGVQNSLPAEELWENIVPTLWVVDQLRHHLGFPVRLTSIYRSETYNAAVGGASRSLHKQNKAIDFQVDGVSPRRAFDTLRAMRSAGTFAGGLGIYSTFVHIDTRGQNATW